MVPGSSALAHTRRTAPRPPTAPPRRERDEDRAPCWGGEEFKQNNSLSQHTGSEKKIAVYLRQTLLSPPRHLSPLAWRASPPALGIAYCTRLPWAPPARWGFPALSGSLALNLGSLPNAGRMSDEVSALVCPFPMMASPGLATMNESSHSQGTPAYLAPLSPPSSLPFLSPR